jgi:hypothetical protein
MGHGRFSGEPQAIWLTQEGTPDRHMRMLQDFSFTDPASRVWSAPAGSIVDGASIPRALWTVVGSPYTGDYRRASIVHDVACDDAGSDKRKRRAADRMFFHACRAGGCSIRESIILYLGVRIGAVAIDVPAWQAAVSFETAGARVQRTGEEVQLEEDFRQITGAVLAEGETDDPRELERRADAALRLVMGPTIVGQAPRKSRATRATRSPARPRSRARRSASGRRALDCPDGVPGKCRRTSGAST